MPRVSKDKEERRQEIIEASASLFLAKGYEQTSVSDIVREVNVAQGTFYYHFKSKNEVLEAVALSVLPEIEEDLSAIERSKDKGATQALQEFTERLLRMQTEHEPILNVLHKKENLLLHETTMDRLMEIVTPLLWGILRQGWNNGEFREIPDEEMAVDALLAAIIHMAHHPGMCSEERSSRSVRTAEVFIERVLGIQPGAFRIKG